MPRLLGWAGPDARVFPRRACFSVDVFALGLILAKLSLTLCNSLPILPNDPNESCALLTDQNKLYSALAVTGAAQLIVEGMLKLIPDDRLTIQDALREYQNIGTTKMHRDKKQIEEKLAQAERDKKKTEI